MTFDSCTCCTSLLSGECDGFHKIVNRKDTHKKFNLLIVITALLGGYLVYGKYAELVEYVQEMDALESFYSNDEILNMAGVVSTAPAPAPKPTTSSTSSRTTTGKSKGKGGPFGEFILGCFLIGFALPMVWMNERRDVKTYKVIAKGKEVAQEIDCNEPSDSNNHALVRASGRASTQIEVTDPSFGYVRADTVKIRRSIEVY